MDDAHLHPPVDETAPNPIVAVDDAPVLRPLALAAIAAIVGGVAWGYVTKTTDYEVGILAWAIGFATGTAAVVGAGGRRGLRLQVLAVALALLGILLGKYAGYALIVQDALADEGVAISVFDRALFEGFRADLSLVFGWFDLLWIGLAMWSAWRIPQPLVPPQAPGHPTAS
jgi:hypothetical protein